MKKQLPVIASKPMPADAQTAAQLAVKPVAAARKPEFPTRGDLYRRAGLLGGAALLVGGIANADTPPMKPAPEKAPVEAKQPAKDPAPTPTPPVDAAALKNGAINGTPIDLKKPPKFKVYREGGGIGPAEDMWEPSEVEAFINWTLAKEGKLNLKTAVKFEHDGIAFELDGYDADKKIGYEYIDKLDSDPYFTKEVRAKLAAWMKAKKVAILFIDMKKTPDQATLKGKIVKFLADVKKTPPAPGAL